MYIPVDHLVGLSARGGTDAALRGLIEDALFAYFEEWIYGTAEHCLFVQGQVENVGDAVEHNHRCSLARRFGMTWARLS